MKENCIFSANCWRLQQEWPNIGSTASSKGTRHLVWPEVDFWEWFYWCRSLMIAKNIQKNRRKIMVTIDDAIGLAVDTCFFIFLFECRYTLYISVWFFLFSTKCSHFSFYLQLTWIILVNPQKKLWVSELIDGRICSIRYLGLSRILHLIGYSDFFL